ncbi:MAG: hypothetical protein LBF22_09070 [Deltaproteobacteria bacterium]|jgi:hypothetical protein|nr:hypothetical protein [Deltaproteobacteria bacterium]
MPKRTQTESPRELPEREPKLGEDYTGRGSYSGGPKKEGKEREFFCMFFG